MSEKETTQQTKVPNATTRAAMEEARSMANDQPANLPPPRGNARGYCFHNPDTGWEWNENHPIKSGECEDATDVKPMRFCTFRSQFMEAKRDR